MSSAATAALLAALLGAPQAVPRRARLQVEGVIRHWSAVDADGDTDLDLVVVHQVGDAPGRREVALFRQAPPGFFGATPDLHREVPEDACAVAYADLLPEAGLEVCFLCPGRVLAASWATRAGGSPPVEVAGGRGFFEHAIGDQLPLWGTGADTDGDGRAELLVPRAGGVEVLGARPGGPDLTALPMEVDLGGGPLAAVMDRFFVARRSMPRPLLADLDGDGRADLCWVEGARLRCRYLGEGAPAGVAEPFRLPEAPEEGKGGFSGQRLALQDLDGDGRAELVATRVEGRMGSLSSIATRVSIYGGRARGEAQASGPDQVISVKGASMDPVAADVDGDGALDLVLSLLRTDLLAAVKGAIFRSVTVTYMVHYRRGGLLERSPGLTRDLALDLERMEGGGTVPHADLSGDLDGDGSGDLLSLEDAGRLKVYRGVRRSGWFSGESFQYDDTPWLDLEVATSNEMRVRDLDGDGRSDVVFGYPDRPGLEGTLELVLPGGGP